MLSHATPTMPQLHKPQVASAAEQCPQLQPITSIIIEAKNYCELSMVSFIRVHRVEFMGGAG
jgi:hypothetical protein